MIKGSNFWVIGGEFGSMNFHKLVEGSAQVKVPSRPVRRPKIAGGRSRRKTAIAVRCASRSWKSRIAQALDGTSRPVKRSVQGEGGPIRFPGGAVRLFICARYKSLEFMGLCGNRGCW